MRNKRYLLIDYLRVIAMLGVMLYHYTVQYDSIFGHINKNGLMFPAWISIVSVNIFFYLVGYFEYSSQKRCFNVPITYLKKRLLRLIPTFWVALIITVVAEAVVENRVASSTAIITNMFLINRLMGLKYIDGVYWYLQVVLFYTIVTTIIIFLNRKTQKDIFPTFLRLYVVVYVLTAIVVLLHINISSMIINLGFRWFSKIVIGNVFARILEIGVESKKKEYLVEIVILLLFAVIWINVLAYDVIAFLMFVVCVVYKEIPLKCKLNKVVIVLSDASYFIYLIHQNIGFILVNLLESRYNLCMWISVLITMALVISCSIVLVNIGRRCSIFVVDLIK